MCAPAKAWTPGSSRRRQSASSLPSPAADALLHDRRDVLDLAADDVAPDLLYLRDVRLRDARIDLAEPDAVLLQPVDGVATIERPLLHGLDRLEDGDVDALRRAGQNGLRSYVRLVGVDADRPHALLPRRVDHTEPAAARYLENDARAGRDLVQRHVLALRLIGKGRIVRVAVNGLDPGIRGLRAGLVAGDEAVDRRLLLAADGAHDVRPRPPPLFEPREVPREIAHLLLAEEQPEHVFRLALQRRLVDVDDRELALRELQRSRIERIDLRVADGDREVVALLREGRQAREVVRRRVGREHAVLHADPLLRVPHADEREVVE